MNIDIRKKTERIYSEIRNNNMYLSQKKIMKVYNEHPDLKAIDDKIKEENANIALSILKDGKPRDSSPEKEKLIDERNRYIKKHKALENFDKPLYNCEKCRDTGTDMSSGKGKCECYSKVAYPVLREKSNFNNLEKYTFEAFDEQLFEENPDKSRYKTDSSPRDIAVMAKKITRDFTENFRIPETKSLFFFGKPGTGKTFVSGCVANEILIRGYSVYYLSAPDFFEKMTEYRMINNSFSPDPVRFETLAKEHDFILNCDLLIIDDLGTETFNSNRQPDLLSVLNHRKGTGRKMIVSTNLGIKELSSIYDERVMSRIYGEFSVIRLIGDDLRHRKRRVL